MQQERGKPTIVRGYIIQSWAPGAHYFDYQTIKSYAVKGQLPAEWQVCKDNPAIGEARIYSTTQIMRRADKRIILDSFKREVTVAAAS